MMRVKLDLHNDYYLIEAINVKFITNSYFDNIYENEMFALSVSQEEKEERQTHIGRDLRPNPG